MALAINTSLTLNATSKDANNKVVANFYASVGPTNANNSLQMTIVDRDLFAANKDTVKANLQTFIDNFWSKYTTDSTD